MGSSEEKPSNLYDSPSSPTQPLLSKPYHSPSPIEESPVPNITSDPTSDPDNTDYLQITYNYGPRQFKDLPFLVLFVILSLCTFGFGIFAVNENSNYSNVSSYTYNSTSSSCVKNSTSTALNLSPGQGSTIPLHRISSMESFDINRIFTSSSSSFLRGMIWVLVITLIMSLPIEWSVLLLLKHYTNSSCSDAFPLAYRILVLVFVFLIIGIVVWIPVLNWHRIELTIQIIGVFSDALLRNLGLLGTLPCLTAGLVVYYAPIALFLIYARFNGKIAASESSGEYTCVWKQDSWVPAYYALGIITMLWSAAIMVEVQAYVVSGTIAQWYFSKYESTRKRKIRSILRNAFGPSFGTICFSGLLIWVARVVRAIVDSAKQDVPGMVNVVLRCCVNVFLSAVDFLNKLTINCGAITGEAYCTSARMTYELLKRNLLSAVFVETISTRLLGGIIFVISAIYAAVVCGILYGITSLGADSYFVAISGWAFLLVVLGFFVHVLDNVIETVYVCYAIDRDRGEVYKPDVHEVYVRLPISRSEKARTPVLNV